MKNILCFGLVVLLLLLALTGISNYINDSYYNKYYSDNSTLILGDSHVRNLNEKIIDNSLNLYRGGQSYKESYYKLKYFDQINNFDNLILSCSYNNFTALADFKINEDYYSIHSIATISSVFDLFSSTKSFDNFSKVLFKVFSLNRLNQYIKSYSSGTKDLKSEVDVDIDYKRLRDIKRNTQKSEIKHGMIKKRIMRHFYYNDQVNQGSDISEYYLDLIIDYCKENKINLVLINMPLHPKYRKLIPKFNVTNFKRIKKRLKQKKMKYIDYTDVYDSDLSMFLDADHCSEYAAGLISKELNEILN